MIVHTANRKIIYLFRFTPLVKHRLRDQRIYVFITLLFNDIIMKVSLLAGRSLLYVYLSHLKIPQQLFINVATLI